MSDSIAARRMTGSPVNKAAGGPQTGRVVAGWLQAPLGQAGLLLGGGVAGWHNLQLDPR
jgi:hypothetical protein